MEILGSIIRYSYSLTKKNCLTVMVVVGIGFIRQGVQSSHDVQRFVERIISQYCRHKPRAYSALGTSCFTQTLRPFSFFQFSVFCARLELEFQEFTGERLRGRRHPRSKPISTKLSLFS